MQILVTFPKGYNYFILAGNTKRHQFVKPMPAILSKESMKHNTYHE